jgi:16S rRNA pseudouridine516 synthase
MCDFLQVKIMRLDKFLSYALNKTRNESRLIIRAGEITVNAITVIKHDFYIDESKDSVCYLGKPIEYRNFVYIMLNKPKGYLSATSDPHFPTVLDLVPEMLRRRLFMAGRLDLDSEGMMILTNDGKFGYHLTSPNRGCEKKYYVEIEPSNSFASADIEAFKSGMIISDGKGIPFMTKPAILEIISAHSAYITVREGKFHQVKNMCLKQGKTVTYLKRVKIGPVELDSSLKPGEYRFLTDSELTQLKK